MADTTVTINAPPAHKIFPFKGFGAQLNTNIFRTEGQPKALTKAQHDALRATIANLKPGHSRIFLGRELTDTPTPPQKELKALLNTIELAEKAGANVNLTFWGQGTFAGMKSLSDEVLRRIGNHKEWTKRYGVIANLVKNPRTPLGISIGLVSRLNPRDIKGLAVDRNVPEVIRKQAQKFLKGGSEDKKK